MPDKAPARVDALAKVTGRAKYLEDLPELPGTLYAATVRSPYSHARIRAIDTSRAEHLRGYAGAVHSLQSHDWGVHLEAGTIQQEFLAIEKARFDGDLLGMVAAEDLRTARAAADLIDVEYELLPAVFSFEEAMASGAMLVHDELGSNLCIADDLAWGDVDEGLRQADRVIEETYYSASVFHHPMEPTISFTVRWVDGLLECWVPGNRPWNQLEDLARLFGLPQSRIRIHTPYIGGSFGAKDMFSAEVQVAAVLSRQTGRPIKLVATEHESFRSTARHGCLYKARLGVSSDGAITVLDVDLELDTGAYFTGAEIVIRNAVTSAMGAYRVPHLRVTGRAAYTNKVPAATYRSTGRSQTTYGLECSVDSAAHSLGVDPIEFRRRNLLRRGEQLAPATWRRRGKEAPAEAPPIDTDFDELLRLAVEGLEGGPEVLLASDEGRRSGARLSHLDALPLWGAREAPFRRGRGIAVSFRRSSDFGRAEAAASLARDGAIAIDHNSPELGTGSHTVLLVIASRVLDVPADAVRIGEADTGNNLYFTGASSQRTTVQMGTAVENACRELRTRILEAAARLHENEPDDWSIVDGSLVCGPRRVSLAELAGSLPQPLQATGKYRAQEAGDNPFEGHDHWSPGAAAAEVEVDVETGEVRLLRYSAVADAGTAVHYPSAKGQVEGGAILGLGVALHEEMLYQDGELQNGDPFQYRLPLMRDIPRFATAMVENADGPGPFGAKAMAQTSLPCAIPAVANAVRDALAVRLEAAPFTPERILQALRKRPVI
ncbi:MAG TPA: xanthine dehydrogenase family protein molybdopterin-binding subunit [Chloroflexota bacterium]|nr:xanthine dehydrogenase family protein molybdopterin-binding subunit [Chloroflexota bacterium]